MDLTISFGSILVVEDDPSHAMLIKRALRGYTAKLEHAASLGEANAALDQSSFDLIVSDLNLPDSEGTTHIAHFRRRAPEAAVVVLTSSTSVQHAVQAMKQGAGDFLVKNFDAEFGQILQLSLSRIQFSLVAAREKARLEREMQALRTAIENSLDSLAVVSENGTIEYCNRSYLAFAERCGGDAKNLESLFNARLNKHESLRDAVAKNRKELAPGGVWQTEITFVEDKVSAFSASLSVIRRAHEHDAAECVLWIRDISELKRREKFQREILSTTTHDLKGPLGAILISADLIGEIVGDNKKAGDLALRIASAAQGAVNLIDEFLSARRIQEGTFILRPSAQNLSEIVGEALENFSPTAGSKSISVVTELPEHLPVWCDRLGISRVIGNLLSNALKFTPKGGRVDVSASEVGDEVRIRVSDTGSGMEPAEVTKLFERFSRLERHREVAGSGIGLFVVKSIVTAHGGKIDVTSALGQGTTFEISLPKKPPVNERGELISLEFR